MRKNLTDDYTPISKEALKDEEISRSENDCSNF